MSRRILKKYGGVHHNNNSNSHQHPYPHLGPKSTRTFKSSSQRSNVSTKYSHLATIVLPEKVRELKHFIETLDDSTSLLDKASEIINHFILNVGTDRDSIEFKQNHLIFKLTLLKLLGDINNEKRGVKNNILTNLISFIAQQLDEDAITGNYIRPSLIGKTKSTFFVVNKSSDIEHYFDVATYLLNYLTENNTSVKFTHKESDFYYYSTDEKQNLQQKGVNVSNAVNFISNTAIRNLAESILRS